VGLCDAAMTFDRHAVHISVSRKMYVRGRADDLRGLIGISRIYITCAGKSITEQYTVVRQYNHTSIQ